MHLSCVGEALIIRGGVERDGVESGRKWTLLAEKKHRAHRKPDNESIKGQFMILIEHFRRILNSFAS